MYRDFPPAVIEDVHKSEGTVTVTTDGDGHHCVKAHAERYSPGVSLWLEPDAARAYARALLEAADEADVRQAEDDELERRCIELREELHARRPLLYLSRSELDARIAAGDPEAIAEDAERGPRYIESR